MKPILTKDQIKIAKIEPLYQGFMSLRRYIFDQPLFADGWHRNVGREILERQAAVGVLLYDPKCEWFVMVEQLRMGALADHHSPWLMEIVAGMVEPEEQVVAVAHRETEEETGCCIKKLLPIQDYWVSPGGSNEYVHLFLGLVDASEAAKHAGLDSEYEDIKVHQFSRAELLQLMAQGRINNAMALIAVQWFLLNEEQLDLTY